MMQKGVKAPKDPTKKGKGFYLLKNQNIAATERMDGCRSQEIYLDNGRILSAAKIAGGIQNEEILKLLETMEGFRQLVTAIGVTVEAERQENFTFRLIAYGKKDTYRSGTHASLSVLSNEVEHILPLEEVDWSKDDKVLGQFAVVFPKQLETASLSIKLYVREGYDVPPETEDEPVEMDSSAYREMIAQSLIQTGNTQRFRRAADKAQRGEDVTLAYIGGSITQGAGAVPAATECYAYRSYKGFCSRFGKGDGENVHFIRAGIGGTSSELGVVRYEKDVLDFGTRQPDIVFVEFAVNDDGDETEGECYEGLIRKIWKAENQPAVVLLFSVFSYDWNLQERFLPMGELYDLPMISIKNAVTEQFALTRGTGRVVAKRQFFYDIYHPSNTGHTIMADCICHYFDMAAQKEEEQADAEAMGEAVVKSADFEQVHFFDRRHCPQQIKIEAGSFQGQDTDLQLVERDLDHFPTPMFPDNWQHIPNGAEKPFVLELRCRLLLLLPKDSAENSFGKAEIVVDGKPVRVYDPNEVGWTHCNAALVLREKEAALHRIEISMLEKEKLFTILGFGYAE